MGKAFGCGGAEPFNNPSLRHFGPSSGDWGCLVPWSLPPLPFAALVAGCLLPRIRSSFVSLPWLRLLLSTGRWATLFPSSSGVRSIRMCGTRSSHNANSCPGAFGIHLALFPGLLSWRPTWCPSCLVSQTFAMLFFQSFSRLSFGVFLWFPFMSGRYRNSPCSDHSLVWVPSGGWYFLPLFGLQGLLVLRRTYLPDRLP